MVRGSMIGLLLVGGCLLGNPAYEDDTGGAATGSASASGGSSTTGTTAGTTGAASSSETGTGGVTTGGVDGTETGSGSSSGGCVGCVCMPGAAEPCYSGEAGTDGVGSCKAGTRVCEPSGAAWGVCEGEVTPAMDVCGDGLDQDCNGMADDDLSCVTDPECPQVAGLVACYPFPDGVLDELRDGSGHGHHGTMVGVTLVGGLGGQGKAGKFMMSSSVGVAEDPELSPDHFTVALLIRPNVGLAAAGLVDKDNQFGLFHHPQGALECIVFNEQGVGKNAVSMVPAGVWSMIACSFDGVAVKLQVFSGGPPPAPTATPLFGKMAPNGSGVRIGSNSPEGDLKYAGDLDRVMFFDRALAPDELCMLAGPMLCV